MNNRFATVALLAFVVALTGLQYVQHARLANIEGQRAERRPGQEGSKPEGALPALPTEPVSLEGAVSRGRPEARVALIEYSDYECPFCGRYASTTLPRILTD